MFDYHLHSEASFDAGSTLLEMANAAKAAGLQEICVTDHAEFDPFSLELGAEFDMEKYIAGFDCELPLPVRHGVEIGAFPGKEKETAALLSSYPFDFVILSQHVTKAHGDPYFPQFFEGRTYRECCEEYLTETLESLSTFSDFDVHGHLGYAAKYAPWDRSLIYSEFTDIIDEILRLIITLGHGIEMNTSGYSAMGHAMPPKHIVKRYLELGGEIITLGSDAHAPQRVGGDFDRALYELRSAGCRAICTFEKRVPVFHKI